MTQLHDLPFEDKMVMLGEKFKIRIRDNNEARGKIQELAVRTGLNMENVALAYEIFNISGVMAHELVNVPLAKDYRTSDDRCISFLIDIMRSACSVDEIDCDRILQYANGTKVPDDIKAVSIATIDLVKWFLELFPRDQAISEVLRLDKTLTWEALLRIISKIEAESVIVSQPQDDDG